MCTHGGNTEVTANFTCPQKKSKPPTRTEWLRQRLWPELEDEYLQRINQFRHSDTSDKFHSEYHKKFCENVRIREDIHKDSAAYPLYETAAITHWNPKGSLAKSFKKPLSITQPVHLQSKQFG